VVAVADDAHVTLDAAQPVLNRVGDHFGEGERKGGGVFAGEGSEGDVFVQVHHGAMEARDFGGEGQHSVEDLIKLDVLGQPGGERVVHHGDGGDPAHRLTQRVFCVFTFGSSCLD